MIDSNIKKMLKGTNTKLISTDKGVIIEGQLTRILSCYSMLTRGLKDNGIPKEIIQKAFELGNMTSEELDAETEKNL